MSGSCCAGLPEGEPFKVEMRAVAKASETAIEQACCGGKPEKPKRATAAAKDRVPGRWPYDATADRLAETRKRGRKDVPQL